MSSFNIKSPNSRFDLIANRIKYGTDGGINVDAGALYVNGINGRVGINTTSPQANFDISGTIRSKSNISSSGITDISGYYEVNGVPINNSFYPALSSATAEKAISTWSQGNSTGVLNSWNCITWSPQLQLFAMVRQVGGNTNRIATSPDGINWILYKQSTKEYQGIVWCNDLSGVGMFIATSSSGGNGNDITYSTDGITWNDVSTPVGSYGAVAYSPSLKRVVATYDNFGFLYSNDGINWSSVQNTITGNRFFYSIAWSPKLNLFVAISITSSSAPIATSPDGINWTYRRAINTSISPFIQNCGLAWSEELGIFCAVGDSKILISSDGIDWYYYAGPILPSRNLSWSSQLRIFLGGSGNSIYYSYNGINWLNKTIGSNTAKASVWSPELGYFLVGGDDTFIWRSSFAGRPPTSFNMFDSSFNNINQLGLWNFQSFGRGAPFNSNVNFTVLPGQNWIDCSSAITITLPTASAWPGREITIRNIAANQILSNASNIVQADNTTINNIILNATARTWCTLVSNGTNWYKLQGNDL